MDPHLADEASEVSEPPLTQQQAEELDRRLEAHRQSPEDVISWTAIKDEVSKIYS